MADKLLQEHITKIEKWLQKKQIKANPNKCNHITFTLRKQIPPNILLNGTHTKTARTNKASQIPRTPPRYTTHRETTY